MQTDTSLKGIWNNKGAKPKQIKILNLIVLNKNSKKYAYR